MLLTKTIAVSILFVLLSTAQVFSQMGCTDPFAENYDPTAVENDGSCVYQDATVSASNSNTLDASLAETSGLIFWNDNLWTHNDSNDTNIYQLNPSNGTILGSISLDPQVNKDWEEISQDENFVYVGDFGNNVNGNRTDLNIIRISKASILAGSPEMDIINFSYEDQVDFNPQGVNNTDYDCEAFIVTDAAIFLFTKEWLSNKTRLYKLPKTPGTHQAQLQDNYNIDGLVTGAVYKKEEDLIVLSGYNSILQPFVFLLYDFSEDDFFGANKRKLGVNLPFHQVEGITTQDGLNYFITNERFDTTGTSQKLHTLDLTPYLEDYLNVVSFEDSVQFNVFPNPTSSYIEVANHQDLFPVRYTIVNAGARKVKEGVLTIQNSTIDLSNMSKGIYILSLDNKNTKAYRIIKK